MSDQFIEGNPKNFLAERRPILVPVDFSSCSGAALLFAAFIEEVSGYVSAPRVLATAQMLLVSGLPVPRIQEVAVQEDAALMVMGTHGRTGLSRLTVGSVATDVARHSRVPVTIVKTLEGRYDRVSADGEDGRPVSPGSGAHG
jgi:hypothetical protein